MILSKDNARFKSWMKLKQKKHRREEGLFLIEGEHLVIEAQKAGLIVDVLLCEGVTLDIDSNVTYLTKSLFEKLTSTVTSAGVMAVCQMKEKEIVEHHRLLLVDNIQDPGNLGTLIRSALAFGFDGVVMSEETVDVYNDKVVRATQGAMFHLPMKITNLVSYLSELHQLGVKSYAAHLDVEAQAMESIIAPDLMAIVVGNEGAGINAELVDACDGSIVIEMSDRVESLNVGVAGSILMQTFNGLS